MESEVVLLEAHELDRAGALIARSFHDDPLLAHVLPDDKDRARRAPAYFAALLRETQAVGEVYGLAPALQAVAAWRRPGGLEEPSKRQEPGADDLPAQLGEEAFDQVLTAVRFIEGFHRHAVPRDHWFLQFVAVEPRQQGRGLGTALLRPILGKADTGGHECYLWTLLERNLPFYSQQAFSVVVNEVEPSTGLRFWGLLWDPVLVADRAIQSRARMTGR